MIRYALVCRADHGFEAWFRNSDAFDEQSRRGLIDCPHCGSADVRKAVMAPAIRTAKARGPTPAPASAETPAPAEPTPSVPAETQNSPPPITDEAAQRLRGLIRELHAKVKAEAQDVGAAFPTEARRIHEGEIPPRPIYGTATGAEARALVEEGVGIMPLPPLPDERN